MIIMSYLRISISPELDIRDLIELIRELHESFEIIRILVSDGFTLDIRVLKKERYIAFQRVLNPHQLGKILMDTGREPHIIILRSEIVDSWDIIDVQALYDILRIKSYGSYCQVYLNIVGEGGVFEQYLGGTINRIQRRMEVSKVGRTVPTVRQAIDDMVSKYRKLGELMGASDRELLESLLISGKRHSTDIALSGVDYETGFILSIMFEMMKIIKNNNR